MVTEKPRRPRRKATNDDPKRKIPPSANPAMNNREIN
jgi:hypothetical protein